MNGAVFSTVGNTLVSEISHFGTHRDKPAAALTVWLS